MARAVAALCEVLGPLSVAPLYRTDPISAIPQDRYFNTAAAGSTTLPPEELLRLANRLEAEAGRPSPAERRRQPPDRPRALDIDLLLYGERILTRPELTVPHPRLRERRFVLAPLAEILPDQPVPPDGIAVAGLLTALDARERARGTVAPAVDRVAWPEDARTVLLESGVLVESGE